MYRRSIVTFIDVLGFKEIVRCRPFEEVEGIVRLMQDFTRVDARDPFAPEVMVFSDSVIRVHSIEDGANARVGYGCVFWEVLNLLHAQMNLVHEGVLIRGGIAIGDIHG